MNHFLQRLGLADLLEQYVPTHDKRCTVSHAAARAARCYASILIEREPIHRQQETVHGFAPGCSGSMTRNDAHR
ncbi:MAG: hypothetical protein IPH83_21190 [Gammaproteobacteria bacterium]|nr:hypothetical protein [Gammaproteobacteria bacterium]